VIHLRINDNPGPGTARQRSLVAAVRPHLLCYGLLLLPIAMVCTFIVIPMVRTVWSSFQAMDARGMAIHFSGWQNYHNLFASTLLQTVLKNTLFYSVLSVVLCLIISFILSIVLNDSRNSSSRFLLIGLFSPTVIPVVAGANIWLYFLAPRFGLLGRILEPFGLGNVNLLGEPTSALCVLVVLFVWKYAPYFTLFLLAALQAIPPDIRDAMRTEDPHHWHSYFKVILPMIAPMIAFVTMMATVYALETVDPVYVMTQGGPGNGTNLIMYYLYQLGFNYFSWGPAAALSTILMVGLSGLSAVSLIILERRAFHWQ